MEMFFNEVYWVSSSGSVHASQNSDFMSAFHLLGLSYGFCIVSLMLFSISSKFWEKFLSNDLGYWLAFLEYSTSYLCHLVQLLNNLFWSFSKCIQKQKSITTPHVPAAQLNRYRLLANLISSTPLNFPSSIVLIKSQTSYFIYKYFTGYH